MTTTTVNAHWAFPLTDANRKLYTQLADARHRLAQATDNVQRIEIRREIGRLTDQIRRLGAAK